MDDKRKSKRALALLFREWNWRTLVRRKHIGELIFTNQGWFRKDNRTVQNVGSPKIKFKFEVGPLGGAPTSEPTHFSISSTGKNERVCWMATPRDEMFLKQRKGRFWGEPIKLTGFFNDPFDPADEEIDLLEFLMPGVVEQLPLLLPGLHGVDAALKERFNG